MKHDWFQKSGEELLAALWRTNPMKVALLRPTFVPNRDTQMTWADISAQEISGPGYTVGGLLLTGKSTPYDPASDRTDFRANDSTWGPGATFITHYAAIYDSGGTQPLWSLVDFEGDKNVDNGVFTIDWATIGLLYVVPV